MSSPGGSSLPDILPLREELSPRLASLEVSVITSIPSTPGARKINELYPGKRTVSKTPEEDMQKATLNARSLVKDEESVKITHFREVTQVLIRPLPNGNQLATGLT